MEIDQNYYDFEKRILKYPNAFIKHHEPPKNVMDFFK